MEDDKVLLENLLLESDELEELEAKLSSFNVFETLGIINAEIRHSNVLSWLLNPLGNHNLSETFLKHFLKRLFYLNKNLISGEIDIFDIETMNLSDFKILREWNNIDLLLVSKTNNVVFTIENKIDSKEHSNQLERYFNIVCKEYNDYKKVFVYLTPNGDTPSDEENWIIFNYKEIKIILENILSKRIDSLSLQVKSFLEQYITILRRYVVGTSEIEEICIKIYSKHQKALDLIYQYKPDIYLEISEYLKGLIKEKKFIIDDSNKSYIRFTSSKLDNILPKDGEGWTTSKRLLLFEFQNKDEKLVLKLIIGPGNDPLRKKIASIAREKPSLFNKSERTIGKKFFTLYSKNILDNKDFEDKALDAFKEKISKKFDKFLEEIPEIETYYTEKWN